MATFISVILRRFPIIAPVRGLRQSAEPVLGLVALNQSCGMQAPFQLPASLEKSSLLRLSARRRTVSVDWAADVKKYAPDADAKTIAGIVRHCGIALQKRDSSLVSFGDKEEVARVRNNFLKKKLGLTDSDADLDKEITAVSVKMKDDRTKNRVTVYYLLAEHFGKLSMFG